MIQHTQLANGRWNELSFLEQMANVGSEVIRAINWQKKGNIPYSKLAFHRALELLSMSLDDPKNSNRCKEILRNYEVTVDYFDGENIFTSTPDQFTNYYMAFTHAANTVRHHI